MHETEVLTELDEGPRCVLLHIPDDIMILAVFCRTQCTVCLECFIILARNTCSAVSALHCTQGAVKSFSAHPLENHNDDKSHVVRTKLSKVSKVSNTRYSTATHVRNWHNLLEP